MAGIQLDDATLREVVAGAVIQTLTPERREIVLRDAVAKLLEPVDSGYGYDKKKISPLQEAFNNAVFVVAREEAVRLVNDDGDIRAKIREMIAGAVDRGLNDEAVISRLATALARAITREG